MGGGGTSDPSARDCRDPSAQVRALPNPSGYAPDLCCQTWHFVPDVLRWRRTYFGPPCNRLYTNAFGESMNCAICSSEFAWTQTRPGRPRTRCDGCRGADRRPRRRPRRQGRPYPPVECRVCGGVFEPLRPDGQVDGGCCRSGATDRRRCWCATRRLIRHQLQLALVGFFGSWPSFRSRKSARDTSYVVHI